MNNFKVYSLLRLFIFTEVCARQAITEYCKQHGLALPNVGDDWANMYRGKTAEVVNLFGTAGDNWDGKSNEYISDSEINRWREFLVITKDDAYRKFFKMSPSVRSWHWQEVMRLRASESFKEELVERKDKGTDYFKKTKSGKQLLQLIRLSRICTDEIFMNMAGDKMLKLIGSPAWKYYYSQMGEDSCGFDGLTNEYLSQTKINQERCELDISRDSFNRYYFLDKGERQLLCETRRFY